MSYSSYVHDILEISGAKEGDLLSIKGEGQELMGTLMPHHEFSHPDILIIKLRNGYNVGVRITPGTKVEMISKGSPKAKVSREQREANGKKEVSFLGTGGTIASYVDYRTGAVHPALSAGELMAAVPEDRGYMQGQGRGPFLHILREYEGRILADHGRSSGR